jgi:hypothetical protein
MRRNNINGADSIASEVARSNHVAFTGNALSKILSHSIMIEFTISDW